MFLIKFIKVGSQSKNNYSTQSSEAEEQSSKRIAELRAMRCWINDPILHLSSQKLVNLLLKYVENLNELKVSNNLNEHVSKSSSIN